MSTATTSSTDRIEKTTVLRAPRSKVWRALTDPAQFSQWFGVVLKDPFVPGARVRGPVTSPGYDHLTMDITIDRVEPERLAELFATIEPELFRYPAIDPPTFRGRAEAFVAGV